jgi:hypothetical protein
MPEYGDYLEEELSKNGEKGEGGKKCNFIIE